MIMLKNIWKSNFIQMKSYLGIENVCVYNKISFGESINLLVTCIMMIKLSH